MFYAFMVICSLAGECSLMAKPETYSQQHLCDSVLRESVALVTNTPEFDKATAEGVSFAAECVNIPDGYDIETHAGQIIRRIMRQPNPDLPEEKS